MLFAASTNPQADLSPIAGRIGPAPRDRDAARGDSHVRQQVQLVMLRPQAERRLPDRRVEKRMPFPYPVHITPVERDGRSQVGETLVVIGKHLSELGFDFYHTDPLPHRRVIASFEMPNGEWVALVLELNWCRFNHHGYYDSGGRFLNVAASPVPLIEDIKAEAALLARREFDSTE